MVSVIPESLRAALRPITVVAGHYGAGKTNFSVNLACDLAAEGVRVTLVDIDVVNPYFRATEQREALEAAGVRLIAPVFAEVGTSLDVPSLTGKVDTAIRSVGANAGADVGESANGGASGAAGEIVIIDAGGDDVGATALGRYASLIGARDYAMLYIANRFRNLVIDPHDAMENLREIEAACHLSATAIVNNSHLKDATTAETVRCGAEYAEKLAGIAGLPVVCTAMPADLACDGIANPYSVAVRVRNPWE